MLMSLAQEDYCKNKQWDPMDPRCARVLMTGRIKTVSKLFVYIKVINNINIYLHY